MSIYIPTDSRYVTQSQLGNYATLNYVQIGLAGKIGATGNPTFSAATGTFTDLNVNGRLKQNGRMYIFYETTTAGINVPAASEVSYPFTTFTTSTNITGNASLSGDGTTFTNISGTTQLWQIIVKQTMTNLDTVNTSRIAIRVYQNSTNKISSSTFIPPSQGTPSTLTTILELAPNDTIRIACYNANASSAIMLYGSSVQILQL